MRRVACDAIRFIYNMGFDDFTKTLEIGHLPVFASVTNNWTDRYNLLRRDFIQGFFSLDDASQAKLWAYGVEKAEQYERRRSTDRG